MSAEEKSMTRPLAAAIEVINLALNAYSDFAQDYVILLTEDAG